MQEQPTTASGVDEVDEPSLADVLHRALAELEHMDAEINSIKAEYALADNDRGEGAMSDDELEKIGAKLERMHDEHLIWFWLTTSSLIHARLAGPEHDLMTMLKSAFFSISTRWLPMDAFAEAWRLMVEEEDDPEFDLSYLDASEGDGDA